MLELPSMKFRTEYTSKPSGLQLNPETPVVLLGSCFTDNIGARMRECRWRAFPNMCGVLYNPASIANILRLCLHPEAMQEAVSESIAERDDLRISWLTDSGTDTYSRAATTERVCHRLAALRERLKEAGAMIVTFGTAWIYELSQRPGYIVSNCHKFPSDSFIRKRLSVSDITTEWNILLNELRETHPQLKIIFTVSPVRHLKDGFEGNSRSKAILQLACEEICGSDDLAEYFPSFEIMNDDLRDYRFYADDLVHPSDTAVDYIWQKFQERYLSEASRALLREGEKVTKRLNHRPILKDNSDMAKYAASCREYEASQIYNAFIAAHPGMLTIDE